MIFITQKESGYEKYRMKIERYYAVNYPFYTMDFHTHSEWEIMYVAYGRAKIFCMEEAGEKIYELREGEYILIEGNIPHKLTVEKETPCRMLNLEGRELRDKEVSFFQSLTKEEGMRSFLEQESSVIAGRDDGRLHEPLVS
ncbi:MAG: AraC family ligand binding domain-containing protein [Lachnospiraceae bacterium]|nr:AraC family ligand binding domain-containing protein [Lachnospiraceae bacterium]